MEQALEQDHIGPLPIAVCIKQVPLLSALRFDPETCQSDVGVVGDVHVLLPLLIEQ